MLTAEVKSFPSDTANTSEEQGYRDVAIFNGKYFAVGTDGRIDRISKSDDKVTLNSSSNYILRCAFSDNEIILTGGDHGTLLYSADGNTFFRAETGTDETINTITSKNGLFLAGADNGNILLSRDGKVWKSIHTRARGNIMSLSARSSVVIGVTDAGEIVKSPDGTGWDVTDYNKEYAGYTKPAKFSKVIATQNSIVIIGTHNDGSPAIIFSTLGNVWAERIPIYHDKDGMISYLDQQPNGIAYDPVMDEFILSCDNGELFSLPSCSKCNKCIKISDNNFRAIIYAGDCLAIAGDNYSFFIQEL